ncbi:MAG: tRNA preQ1(34) S-adenosylmethionine ribosyltransferase-isomerase QueA [Oscillospiraceae bacterium]|jgi:S-adenosylmethionine:tRNA ribosyltransferase-isomerase|nr:tRNA preQ1(34) S-adenosylmethionine ribosyltransferase-isomerase QueA [Oscillospiraceae bacterium]
MKRTEFYYDLPETLIAQTPLETRKNSRLLKLDRQTGDITHDHFYNLCSCFRKNDLLVMNNSKVLPARLKGRAGDTDVEFLLLEALGGGNWEVICKPGKKVKQGTQVVFGFVTADVLEVKPDGNRVVHFNCEGDFFDILDEIGEMPLPPYITEPLKDKNRYQTVYAQGIAGSAAAPTAGLHFTPDLLDEVRACGIGTAFITLHVGLGTFRPVKADNIEDHKMHREYYSISAETADKINRTKQNGGRVIAVGTTACRTLESSFTPGTGIKPGSAYTDIFIYPGYEFKCIDGLITNFHLSESTLIMLVSAFAGYENTMNAYKTAIHEKYRFLSFGDSMAII